MRGASAVAAAAFAFALAGCGGSGGSTPRYGGGGGGATDGRSVFVQQCGSCHRLADAGTEGVAGKSLDEVRPTAAAVLRAIADGPQTMPAGLVGGAEARQVAAYVARVAGR